MFLVCENVITQAEQMELESTALMFKPTESVNRVMTYLGLESSTVLHQYVSTEGLFSWVKEKLARIGRSITVAFNKIYAKLTRADQATKDLIERASKDDSVQLPISGKKLATIAAIAVAAATVITVTCVALTSGKTEDKEKSKSLFARFKEMVGLKGDSKEKDGEKVKSSLIKSVVGKIRKSISSIKKSLQDFFARFKRTGSDAERIAKQQDGSENKGILGKLKGIGGAIKRMFSTVVEFVRNVINKFTADADAPTEPEGTDFENADVTTLSLGGAKRWAKEQWYKLRNTRLRPDITANMLDEYRRYEETADLVKEWALLTKEIDGHYDAAYNQYKSREKQAASNIDVKQAFDELEKNWHSITSEYESSLEKMEKISFRFMNDCDEGLVDRLPNEDPRFGNEPIPDDPQKMKDYTVRQLRKETDRAKTIIGALKNKRSSSHARRTLDNIESKLEYEAGRFIKSVAPYSKIDPKEGLKLIQRLRDIIKPLIEKAKAAAR